MLVADRLFSKYKSLVASGLAAVLLAGTALSAAPLAAAPVDPAALLVVDAVLADEALASCIRDYAREQGYLTVADVHEVPCFNRGIKSVQGLEVFSETLVIDLSRNDISDWSPLMALPTANLGYIDIHDNPISCDQMIALSRYLRGAYRVGFDPESCVLAVAP